MSGVYDPTLGCIIQLYPVNVAVKAIVMKNRHLVLADPGVIAGVNLNLEKEPNQHYLYLMLSHHPMLKDLYRHLGQKAQHRVHPKWV